MPYPPQTQTSDLIAQISKNLSNTRSTFGLSSTQYRAVFEALQECIKEAEQAKARRHGHDGDGDGDVEELRMLLERELRLIG